MFYKVVILVTFILATQTAKLPSYITQCSKSDPKLNDCIANNANLAIPLLSKGDIHYGIPNLEPLRLDYAILRNDKDLKFILREVQIYGINKAKVSRAMINLDEGTAEYLINIPSLVILSNDYTLSGKLLNVTMYGNGRANITLVGGQFTYAPTFGPRSYEFDSLYELGGHTLKYKTNRTIYNLENLFIQNEFLDYDPNLILNEYWQKVSETLKPTASKIIAGVSKAIFENFIKIVSVDEYFKDK